MKKILVCPMKFFLSALATLKPQAGIVAMAPTPVAPAIPNVNVSVLSLLLSNENHKCAIFLP